MSCCAQSQHPEIAQIKLKDKHAYAYIERDNLSLDYLDSATGTRNDEVEISCI